MACQNLRDVDACLPESGILAGTARSVLMYCRSQVYRAGRIIDLFLCSLNLI
jgi:hypothetical protein